MKHLYSAFYLVILIGVVAAYVNWVHTYNAALKQWEPIVEECSRSGGFMDAEGICIHQ